MFIVWYDVHDGKVETTVNNQVYVSVSKVHTVFLACPVNPHFQ